MPLREILALSQARHFLGRADLPGRDEQRCLGRLSPRMRGGCAGLVYHEAERSTRSQITIDKLAAATKVAKMQSLCHDRACVAGLQRSQRAALLKRPPGWRTALEWTFCRQKRPKDPALFLLMETRGLG